MRFRCLLCGRKRQWGETCTNGGGFPLWLFRVCKETDQACDQVCSDMWRRGWMPQPSRRYRLAQRYAVRWFLPAHHAARLRLHLDWLARSLVTPERYRV